MPRKKKNQTHQAPRTPDDSWKNKKGLGYLLTIIFAVVTLIMVVLWGVLPAFM